MVRTQSKTSANTPAVATPVANPATTETKPAPATKAVKATKKVEAAPAPVATPVVAAPVVVEAAPAATETSSRDDRHKAALKSIDDQVATLKSLRATLVANFKADGVDLKAAQKAGGRRRRAAPAPGDENKAKRAPSGITKPTNVSDAICEFMGKPKGSLIARTEVTKFITNYIKEKNLKDANVKRHINPDASLRKLLNVPQADQLTYFNLQKYMSAHFPSNKTVAVASA